MSYSQRSYCFTSFSESKPTFGDKIRYMIYQQEKCPKSGKLHWQGYAELKNKLTLKSFQLEIGDEKAHIEKRMGTREQARLYCCKQNTRTKGPFEMGNWSSGGQGARTDLRDIAEMARSHDDLWFLDNEPEILYKYERWINKVRFLEQERKKKEYIDSHLTAKLNKWQEEWMTYIHNQNDRQITWVNDSQGGKGKTFFSKYLIAKEKAIRFTNGRTADITAAYNYEPIVIFDFARSCEERINYQIIEDLKNGMLFNSKYKSHTKYFAPPKVIIMANFAPQKDKLSQDRWVILEPAAEPTSPFLGK